MPKEKKSTPDEVNDKVNVHEGHRERVRERIRTGGIESLADHEILEYLLFMATPRKDVNGLAHELIEKFGGLGGVFDATEKDLLSIPGVTKAAALFLSNFGGIYSRYMQSKEQNKKYLRTKREMCNFFVDRIGHEKTEIALLACLDVHLRLKRLIRYSGDNVREISLPLKQVISSIASTNCSYVVFAHNHPGNSTTPSKNDIDYTNTLRKQLDIFGITLIESIVVTYNSATCIIDYCKKKYTDMGSNLTNAEYELAQTATIVQCEFSTYGNGGYKVTYCREGENNTSGGFYEEEIVLNTSTDNNKTKTNPNAKKDNSNSDK